MLQVEAMRLIITRTILLLNSKTNTKALRIFDVPGNKIEFFYSYYACYFWAHNTTICTKYFYYFLSSDDV